MQRSSFWLQRPTRRRAALWAFWIALTAPLLAWSATRLSPFSARSHLQLASGEIDELYLTSLPEDPARVLLTTRRENSTWTRDRSSQAGDPYWVRSYRDPARPGLPERLLLTSRSRGAHLLVPVGALDLERALAEPVDPAPVAEGSPRLRCSLTQLYWHRSFAGLYLHLRFPERVPLALPGEELDHDLVIVRGNELVTTDFLLQPNGELYRHALDDGRMPAGRLCRNAATGDELVLLVSEDRKRPGVPLYSPISLLDELRLCWGGELETILDDRWRLDSAPAWELHKPAREVRARVAWNGTLHLAARLESAEERRMLERALSRFAGS